MESLFELFQDERGMAMLRAAILIVAGLLFARLLAMVTARVLEGRAGTAQARVIRRGVYYLVLALFFTSALRELGFSLATIIGAAGIFSVAIGFAAQTSASNFISGLFLMAEKPFSEGDFISVGGTLGEVIAIDLLSVKLRTPDNLFVRIPNETLLKSESTNLTRFDIRRADLKVGVAYKEDIARVRDVLQQIADELPLCLEEPKPLFILLGFGDSSIDIQFSVWARRENFLELKNSFQEQIKLRFDEAGIEIPFPHRSLYAGSVSEPLPIRIVGE